MKGHVLPTRQHMVSAAAAHSRGYGILLLPMQHPPATSATHTYVPVIDKVPSPR